MAFDKKHYKEIKKFMDRQVSHTPWQYKGKQMPVYLGRNVSSSNFRLCL